MEKDSENIRSTGRQKSSRMVCGYSSSLIIMKFLERFQFYTRLLVSRCINGVKRLPHRLIGRHKSLPGLLPDCGSCIMPGSPLTKADYDLMVDAVKAKRDHWRFHCTKFDYYGPDAGPEPIEGLAKRFRRPPSPFPTAEDGARFHANLALYSELLEKLEYWKRVVEAGELIEEAKTVLVGVSPGRLPGLIGSSVPGGVRDCQGAVCEGAGSEDGSCLVTGVPELRS